MRWCWEDAGLSGPTSWIACAHLDFGNRAYLHSTLSGCDVVYHLINTTVPRTSNDDPVFDIMSNVVETIYLLDQRVEIATGQPVELIGEVVDRPFDVSHTPKMPHDVPNIFQDVSRPAALQLGWAPTTSLRSGIERTWSFVASCAGPANQLP